MVGKKLNEVGSLVAGDIGVIAKSGITATNTSLVEGGDGSLIFKPIAFPQPIYALAISSDDKKAEVKMNEALNKIAEEDLTFTIGFNEETKENVVAGQGELHLNMILDRVRDRQKVDRTKRPESPIGKRSARRVRFVNTPTKASGGTVSTPASSSISSRPSGANTTPSRTSSKAAPSRDIFPESRKAFDRWRKDSASPMMDIGITLHDGKEHPVDSSEMAFKLIAKAR